MPASHGEDQDEQTFSRCRPLESHERTDGQDGPGAGLLGSGMVRWGVRVVGDLACPSNS